jgi:cyclomaltodextrinase / maltogenic alpha-amylase / neopullulanase
VSYSQRCPTLVYEVVPDRFDPGAEEPPLRSLKKRLSHLERLGVDGLALTPIFPSPEPLRLHSSDFFAVDPALGTEADFRELCIAAAERGIAVVLMGVFDQVSATHPWFASACAHGDDESQYPPEQRTRQYFTFGAHYPQGYASRDEGGSAPDLDLASPQVRRRLFTGENSVVHHWLNLGARGWRILRADAVGYSILRESSRGSLTVAGDHFVVGDIKGFADRYVKDGLLDAVVNHYLREGVLSYLRGQVPARQLARVLKDLSERYGRALSRCWNMLSGHDTARLSFLVGDVGRARLGTLLGYTLPGCAHVFYGDEVGLTGKDPPRHTPPMTWEERRWDKETLELHVQLGALRRDRHALRTGGFIDLTPEGEEEIVAYARVTPDPRETVIIAVNRAAQTRVRKLFAPVCDLPDGLKLRDALGGPGAIVRSGSITLEVGAQQARILVPDEKDPAGARFFRGY